MNEPAIRFEWWSTLYHNNHVGFVLIVANLLFQVTIIWAEKIGIIKFNIMLRDKSSLDICWNREKKLSCTIAYIIEDHLSHQWPMQLVFMLFFVLFGLYNQSFFLLNRYQSSSRGWSTKLILPKFLNQFDWLSCEGM